MQREIHARMEQETAKPRHLARSLSYVQRAVDATRSNDMEVSPYTIQTCCKASSSVDYSAAAGSLEWLLPRLRMSSDMSFWRQICNAVWLHQCTKPQCYSTLQAEGGLAETLTQIVNVTQPSPRFVRYHEHHLQRHLSLLGAYPPK